MPPTYVTPFTTQAPQPQASSTSLPFSFTPTPTPPAPAPTFTSPFPAQPTPPEPQVTITTPEKRMIERKQTLWDIPSLPSPARTPAPAPPQLTIPEFPQTISNPASPREPPPTKTHHMDLPPTPTARWFDPTSGGGSSTPESISPQKRKSVVHLSHLQMPQSPATPDMLSPLQTFTSGPFKPAFAPGTPIEPVASSSKLPPTPTQKTNGHPSAKGKEKEILSDLIEPPHLTELGISFARRSLLVKNSFKRWFDRTKYEEAFRRSTEYKERIQRERLFASMTSSPSQSRGSTPPKRRRMSVDGVTETIQAKRKKRRISAEYVTPLDDDALAQQFKEVSNVIIIMLQVKIFIICGTM